MMYDATIPTSPLKRSNQEDTRVSNANQSSLFSDQDLAPFTTGTNEASLIALSLLPGVGFLTLRALFEAVDGNLNQVWNLDKAKLLSCLKKARAAHAEQLVDQITSGRTQLLERAGERLQRLNSQRRVSIVFRNTSEYPAQLNQLASPPLWLFVEGDATVLHDPTIVGVVGTRRPTASGIQATKRLSTLLVKAGCVIVSGLAEGIDAAAQQVAVDNGMPTIAVLGHGIDVVYPQSTSGLRREIVERGGAVISEYLPGDTISKERFVQRNRIQAGLAHAVAVVEGQSKSGTAHTLRFSVELARPIFGVRLGELLPIPEQQLLRDLETIHNAPVFDMERPERHSDLVEYLKKHLAIKSAKDRARAAPIFQSILDEIARVATLRRATDRDFDWLIKNVEHLREMLLHEAQDPDGRHDGHESIVAVNKAATETNMTKSTGTRNHAD